MSRRLRAAICVLLLLIVSQTPLPGRAERQITDLHTLDAYFALYAPDTNVPWQPATVRLETYTNAPVDFSVYAVDPGDVLTAGSNAQPRAVDTGRMTPIARWQFTPPGGYQYQSTDIEVPLGNREGFFVVEARRGEIGEQVWINRTRVGLLVQETPSGLVIYGADLGTGSALAGMRVQLLIGDRFVTRTTDAHGVLRWNGAPPIFVLTQWGASYAFDSPPPQPPVPGEIVGVRVDSAVVHAGDTVRAIGFARRRVGRELHVAAGEVEIELRDGATLIARRDARLDAAGAFSSSFALPADAPAGEYAVLARADDAVGSTTLNVDADADGLALRLVPACGGACAPGADVPLFVEARRDGRPASGVRVEVDVVRSPHAASETPDGAQSWGLAPWFDATVTTGANGRASMTIPHPTDGLDSTYGVHAESGGADADTRIVAADPNAVVTLALDGDTIADGSPLGFEVGVAQGVGGLPLRGARVTVTAQQGPNAQQQVLALDDAGRARGAFAQLPLGTSTILAQVTVAGATAADAAQVTVVPQLAADPGEGASANVAIATDRALYRPDENVAITASDTGSAGDALLSLQGLFAAQVAVAPVNAGAVRASFRATAMSGAQYAVAAFVSGGALEWNAAPVRLDGVDHPVTERLALDASTYAPGALATARLIGGDDGAGTLALRISDGEPSGGAVFDTLGDALSVDLLSTQSSASSAGTWHAWVDSTGSHAQIPTYETRGAPPPEVTLEQADSQTYFWSVERAAGETLEFHVPKWRGNYTLSVLKIGDDGRIASATSSIVVQ